VAAPVMLALTSSGRCVAVTSSMFSSRPAWEIKASSRGIESALQNCQSSSTSTNFLPGPRRHAP
jgi:hypothetical protein